jgi:hypothetical protein
VLSRQGKRIGFAYDNADTIWSSPALFKMPGRNRDDVFLGSDAEVVPFVVEFEVAVPRLSPANW